MKSDRPARAWMALLAAALTAACADERAGSPGDVQSAASQPSQASPATIANGLAGQIGERVHVQGVYQGFMVRPCRFPEEVRPTSLTRSDWLLRQEDVCVYVTGGRPSGIAPLDTSRVGETVNVIAEIRQDEQGRIYLLFLQGEVSP
ncbi:hypothetical protein E5163_11400 [Marinicauda algicola]|uniref:Lipoprotein n=1 Tax=Marinicauda algicola TaxID=2029849 RepID=A0A4S2GZ49_9PROT|nr:hypothetical protein [Marinicauda algicola]TGY88416.1 hypothetical protein E5163_11400 [Marinicauda algicola]